MLNKKNKPLYKGDYLIFVGSPELLSRHLKSIMLFKYLKSLFSMFIQRNYINLIIKKIDKNIYTYKLKKKGSN